MNENPFTQIITELKNASINSINIPIIGIGTVLSPPPLTKIKYGDLVLDNDNLIFSQHILDNYVRKANIEGVINIVDNTPSGSLDLRVSNTQTYTVIKTALQSTFSINNAIITTTDTLKSGDMVILVSTADKQKFIVYDKAVTL